jgi:hypothetical protein
MKKTATTLAILATLVMAPAQSASLEMVSLDAVEQAINDSNVKGQAAIDKFAAKVVDGITDLFALLEVKKD